MFQIPEYIKKIGEAMGMNQWKLYKDQEWSASRFDKDMGMGKVHLIADHSKWWKTEILPHFWKDNSEDIQYYRVASKTWNCMRFNEMKEEAKNFRKNGYISRKGNLKTFKIDGKTLYYLVFQKLPNAQDITGMVAGGFMVDGYGYLFKSKSHRNKIHKLINK